jgi:hypothetical protein
LGSGVVLLVGELPSSHKATKLRRDTSVFAKATPRQDAAAIDLESGKGRVCGGLRSGLLVFEESRQRRVDRQTPFS